MQSESFRKFLRQELVQRCKKNPTYSLRAFATFLKTDHSTLAKLLNGKRNFGKDLIQRYGERLGLTPNEIDKFINPSRNTLNQKDLELRNQTSTIIAISTCQLPETIEKITVFRRELAQFLSRSEACDEVYQLSISLFPLSKTKGSRS